MTGHVVVIGGGATGLSTAFWLRRVLAAVPGDTVVAPGHGPMTTAANELRYNPFVS